MKIQLLIALAVVVSACPPPNGGVDAGPGPKPQVFLTVQNATVLGSKITGTTSVSGCSAVAGVEILATDLSFIVNAGYSGNPSPWVIDQSLLNRFYAASGFALPLSLIAKVTCEDGRTNVSQPVSVTFLPVSTVVAQAGVQMVPDSFVAEGGLGGTATTFIGCIGIQQGRALVRTDVNGNILQANTQLPFLCTYNSFITDRSTTNFTRWLMEPGVGAFAFDQDLNITNILDTPVKQIAVAGDSSAIVWVEDGAGTNVIMRVGTRPVDAGVPAMWSVEFPAVMNAAPVIDTGNGWVYTSSWQYRSATGIGNTVMIKYSLENGAILNADNGLVPILVSQNFGLSGNQPLTPQGSFNVDGTILYLALMAFDANENITTSVVACATGAGGCQNSSRRWTSDIFTSVVTTVVPYSNGNFIAAASESEVFFLSSTDGTVQNLGKVPLRPTGSLRVKALQPGKGADFYLLNGPNSTSYPSEILATDAPARGELWKIAVGSGQTPTTGMFIAIDDSGQPWMRVGLDLIKPLKNSDYRSARGATPNP